MQFILPNGGPFFESWDSASFLSELGLLVVTLMPLVTKSALSRKKEKMKEKKSKEKIVW